MISCLPATPGELLGQANRLDDLADLSLERGARERGLGQEQRPDQLLGDRRCAARVAGQGVQARREDPGRIEAGVLPERLVLGGRGGVDENGRDLVVRDDVALLASKGGELDLAGPVEDLGLLGEVEVVEDLLRVGKALAVVRERGHRSHEPDDARDEKRGEQEHGEGDGDPCDVRITGRALPRAVPAAALPAGKAGLHGVGHDSIGAMHSRSRSRARFDASARPAATP